MCEGTIQEKFDVEERSLLFLSLLIFNQNMFGAFAEKFRHGGRTCISRLKMILPTRKKNKSLEWHINLFFFWEFERQIYGVWCGSFMHSCQNCILHVRRDNSRKNWRWGKHLLFLSLLNFIQNMFGVFAEKFRHGGQNCVSIQRMIIPGKNTSLE